MNNTNSFSKTVLQSLGLGETEASVLPVARAALGLVAILRGWKKNSSKDIVAMPGAVCHDVVAAVLEAGCRPFFCDVDPFNGLVTKSEWLRARKAGATAAIVVHLYGNDADIETVQHIFPSSECLVIDDAAQALGTKYGTKQVGSGGDVGLVSFGATKHISVGGAAILIRNTELLMCAESEVNMMRNVDGTTRAQAAEKFRRSFESARVNLRESQDNTKFIGLLNGYKAELYPPLSIMNCERVEHALRTLPEVIRQRQKKTKLWGDLLQGCGLVPVGMGEGAVPWRYTCRLPNINWMEQYVLGEAMRSKGLNVSHWYLPANWFLKESASHHLSGVEQLAREVFQFWIDEHTSIKDINDGAMVVHDVIKRFYQ